MEAIFKYEEYSSWSRMLAKQHTVDELNKMLWISNKKSNNYKKEHENAVKKENRKVACSQRLAQSAVKLTSNWDKINAIENAIELHKFYPEHCK